jgi:hypothetical protein
LPPLRIGMHAKLGDEIAQCVVGDRLGHRDGPASARVVDVTQEAGGGFKIVVPAAELGIDASRRDVNTLTLSWDKVESNALR